MDTLSPKALQQLKNIQDAGGEVIGYAGEYDELRNLGLVDVFSYGSGWDENEKVKLTNNGRRNLGVDVETPPPNKSIRTRLQRFWGKRRVAQ